MQEKLRQHLLGKRIKQLREKRGFTQEELCLKINIEQPNLSNIEQGKSYPSLPTFLSIVEALEVNPNDILMVPKFNSIESLVGEQEIEILNYIIKLPDATKQIVTEIIRSAN